MSDFFRRRSWTDRNLHLHYRPLLESLESRDLLAFNLSLSLDKTVGVASSIANGTTTFVANATGANLSVDDIDTELQAGRNVVVDGGSTGAEVGKISTSGFTTHAFVNAGNAGLDIKSGSGTNLVGDISLSGFTLKNSGILIIQASRNVTLSSTFVATQIVVTSTTGSITMPAGQLQANNLNLSAQTIGSSSEPLFTSVDVLTADTSSGNGDQFITEANGLTALNLSAGTGNVTLTVTAGAVLDGDASTDITVAAANIILNATTARDFGASAHPIGTNVDSLTISTVVGGGSQFITEANSLKALNLSAGSGDVTLDVALGSVDDPDGGADISASAATVTLSGPSGGGFGVFEPINTSVNDLSVSTAAGGGFQFILEADGLSALNLNAGTGGILLNVLQGAVTDTDDAPDITAGSAIVGLDDTIARDFGDSVHPINTSVDDLTVSTADGGGTQRITESNGLTALDLNAGNAGIVTLFVAQGAVTDNDTLADVTASAAGIQLNDTTAQNFGAIANPIGTSVFDVLTVRTLAGNGSQFIAQSGFLNTLALNAGTGDVAVAAANGTAKSAIIFASAANITVSDPIARDIGAAGSGFQTFVTDLSVNTAAGGGSQFITQSGRLTALNLNAGAGNVTLVVSQGAVADNDIGDDITAAVANITLSDLVDPKFGLPGRPINTAVNQLSVNTAAGNGFQYLAEKDTVTVNRLDAGTGFIILDGGTFNLAGDDNLADSSSLVVESSTILNLGSSDETIGGLVGAGTVAFKADGVGHSLTVTVAGFSFFSGSLIGNDLAGSVPLDKLIKAGSGELVLDGANSFTGAYSVQGGTLSVTGSIAASTAHVTLSGADTTLTGTGMIDREVDFASGTHLAPGDVEGVLSTGDLVFSTGSSLDLDITSAAAGKFDQANVTGSVGVASISPGVALTVKVLKPVNLQPNDQLVVVNNDGSDAMRGTFAGLPEGANLGSNFLGSGLTAKITYIGGDGNDVAINLSPGSLFPWHNDVKALDVTGAGGQPDGHVVPADALVVINYINAFGAGPVPANAIIGQPFGFLDTHADNNVSPLDALEVINAVNSGLGGEGEEVSAAKSRSSTFVGDEPVSISRCPSEQPQESNLIALLALDIASQSKRRPSMWPPS